MTSCGYESNQKLQGQFVGYVKVRFFALPLNIKNEVNRIKSALLASSCHPRAPPNRAISRLIPFTIYFITSKHQNIYHATIAQIMIP